ncbi:MAG: SBBP repeat-containing protein [Proteobacteria bacterium]|nr:SBBP repeat-containing protein [Pseudomonadota bacterium]
MRNRLACLLFALFGCWSCGGDDGSGGGGAGGGAQCAQLPPLAILQRNCRRLQDGSPEVWARCVGGLAQDHGNAVAVGADGSIYMGFGVGGPDAQDAAVLASCYGISAAEVAQVMFEQTPTTAASPSDPGIAKYNSAGILEWVRTVPVNGLGGEVLSVAALGDRIVIAGDFHGTAQFGPAQTLGSEYTDLFVAEYDALGTLIWVKSASLMPDPERMLTHAEAESVEIDPLSGNIVVSGQFSGLLSFAPGVQLQAQGSTDLFLAEYDPTGNVLWVDEAGGDGDASTGKDVTIEPDGSVMVIGTLAGAGDDHLLDNQGNQVVLPSFSAGVGSDMVLAHYDAAGGLLWATHAGYPNRTMTGTGVSHDASGNVYVTGAFSECAFFPRQPQLPVPASVPVNIGPPFDPSSSSPPPCHGTGAFEALTAPDGNLAEQYLAKYSELGALLWVQVAGGPGYDAGVAVEVYHPAPGAPGFVYLGGTMRQSLDFGLPPNLQSAFAIGESAHSIAKFDLEGTLLWATSVGADGDSQLHDIALDPRDGAPVGVGDFNGSLQYPSGVLLQSVPPEVILRDDIVLWRLGPNGP